MCYWEYTQKQNWIMVVSVKTITIMSNQRKLDQHQMSHLFQLYISFIKK